MAETKGNPVSVTLKMGIVTSEEFRAVQKEVSVTIVGHSETDCVRQAVAVALREAHVPNTPPGVDEPGTTEVLYVPYILSSVLRNGLKPCLTSYDTLQECEDALAEAKERGLLVSACIYQSIDYRS